MDQVTISKPLHRILADLTGEQRVDVALQLATKDLVRLKLRDAEERIRGFEARYQMEFAKFKQAWKEGQIPNQYSFEVERDYWEWEAATADEKRLREMSNELL